MSLNNSEQAELAAQLRCPSGDKGINIAQNMDITNARMIERAIESLKLNDHDRVLEIGPGNGGHVWKILEKAAGIYYQGADISETMIAEAEKLNEGVANVFFRLTDGKTIPFEDEKFHKIFTTNTIYFWEKPKEYAQEINRVLKTGETLSIGFIPKRVMQHIPFAQHGFTLYDEDTLKEVLTSAGFEVIATITEKETITGPHGEDIEREFTIVTARK
jgi:ubiquinone/menaquinone biosynthesis C-methylase UbiE